MFPESANYLTCEVNDMLKKILSRSLISAPASMLIHQLVALCSSLANGVGRYLPVTAAFGARFDN